jgi:hypothetical protein
MTEAIGPAIDETIAMSPFKITPRGASVSSQSTKTRNSGLLYNGEPPGLTMPRAVRPANQEG